MSQREGILCGLPQILLWSRAETHAHTFHSFDTDISNRVARYRRVYGFVAS
jgi:hypothetical protein